MKKTFLNLQLTIDNYQLTIVNCKLSIIPSKSSMKNEVKIGLLAVTALLLLVWGYKFLKGQNILSPATTLFAEYKNVEQLTPSSSVLVNGLKVGVVTDIYLKPEDMETVVVKMAIDRHINIHKKTVARIISAGLMGGKAVKLEIPTICNGPDCAKNGEYIKGGAQGALESFMGSPDDVVPYMNNVTRGLTMAVDSIALSKSPIGYSIQNTEKTLKNLVAITNSLNRLVAGSTGNINKIMANLEGVSGNLQASNNQIRSIVNNLDGFSSNLKNTNINATLGKANNAIDSAAISVAAIKGTLAATDKTIADLNLVITKVKNGEGSLGKLINDDKIVTQIEATTQNLELLLQDVRMDPRRYVPFKWWKRPYKPHPQDSILIKKK
jgi:phospholipid/cholesterol/gamma-HCH transport system substrate-binding protein